MDTPYGAMLYFFIGNTTTKFANSRACPLAVTLEPRWKEQLVIHTYHHC